MHLHLCDIELGRHYTVVALVAVDRSRPQQVDLHLS
jgi:hypothetical protein